MDKPNTLMVFTLWLTLLVFVKTTNSLIISEYQDVAIMAHVIGSGAMNMEHYFNALGVACENRNQRFWKNIQEEHKKCMNVRDSASSRSYFESLPQGSFEKMCRNWNNNEICNINFARDLNDCLGGSRGSDALEFMDAYIAFTCRDIHDTESQLAIHTQKRTPSVSPGVFKCFPELQDRILNCVKEDTRSHSLCSQFSTVQQCFGRFYANYKDCDNIGVVGYLRDLFRSMVYTLKCPAGPDVWNNNNNNYNAYEPRPQLLIPYTTPKPSQIPESPRFYPNYPTTATVPFNFVANRQSRPYQSHNSPQFNIVSPTTTPEFQNVPYQQQSVLWEPVPLQIPFSPAVGSKLYPLSPPPQVSHHNNNANNKEQADDYSPLGAWFNLQQQKFSRNNNNAPPGPTWAWGYERYANPNAEGDRDRFYSFRTEPREENEDERYINTPHNNQESRGVYDAFQVNYDRYGLGQQSRALSNRKNNNTQDAEKIWRKPKVLIVKDDNRQSDYQFDNHLRKFKDDHMFQGDQVTPIKITSKPRFTHSVPSSISVKRKVKGFNEENNEQYISEKYEEENELKYPSSTTPYPLITTPTPTIPTNVFNRPQKMNRNINKYTTPSPTRSTTSRYTGIIPDIESQQQQQPSTILTPKYYQRVNSLQPTTPSYSSSRNQTYYSTPTNSPTFFKKPVISLKFRSSSTPPPRTRINATVTKSNTTASIRKYPTVSKNNITFTFPPWPRQRNTEKIYKKVANPDEQIDSPIIASHFDSKRVDSSTRPTSSSSLSQFKKPVIIDEEHQDNLAFTQPEINVIKRPQTLRKIKVRKRPSTSTTTPTPIFIEYADSSSSSTEYYLY